MTTIFCLQAKIKLKRMRGMHRHQLPSYLDEFMWRERKGRTTSDAFKNILHEISSLYRDITIKCCIFIFARKKCAKISWYGSAYIP